jgi:outer membrane lipopolysaccharide assembly protein LptE/RlpB
MIMYQKIKIIWLILSVLLAISGCGYHLPRGGGFPEGVDRIFVEILENSTTETGVETIVTQNLVNEFVLREKKSLTSNLNDADAILSGDVSKITIQTIAAKGRDSARERRVTVTINLKLGNREGRVIWAAKGLSDNQAYFVAEDKNVTEKNKRNAIKLASKRIAERALNRLTDDF